MRRVKGMLHHNRSPANAAPVNQTGTNFVNTTGSTFNNPAMSETTVTTTSVESVTPLNTGLASTATTMTAPITNVLPAQVEIREKPAVIQEVIRPGVREEVQPVIHRDREQLEIREEIQPIYERSIRGTVVEERQLAPEMRPEVRMGAMPILAEGPRSGVVVEREQREAVMRAPIVEETIHKKIVEEIQPVIHREVIAPRVIHETKPIFEKVVEAPVVSYSTLPPRFVGNEFSHISSWRQGQPIPQGWRLGRRGFLKPVITLPPHLQNWQQGQPIPEGYRVGKRGNLRPLNYGYNNFGNNYGTSGLGNNFGTLPPAVANWQQGQPIPEGWRLGRKGFLKPNYTLPSHLQNWQQGQPIPEGYRVGKRGTLKPLNYGYNNFGGNNFNNLNNQFNNLGLRETGIPVASTSGAEFVPIKNQQFANASYVPSPVQKF